MSKQEMRFIRREWIQSYLGAWNRLEYGIPSQSSIKGHVRMAEKMNYGHELKVYVP